MRGWQRQLFTTPHIALDAINDSNALFAGHVLAKYSTRARPGRGAAEGA